MDNPNVPGVTIECVRRSFKWLVAAAAAANAIGAAVVAWRAPEPTSYAAASTAAVVAMVVVSLALIATGIALSEAVLARLALLAGALWAMPAWVGWEDGPPFVVSAAEVLTAFLYPALVHATLAHPTGEVRPWQARLLVGGAWGWASLSALTLALFRDPFYDADCWSNCTENVFLLANRPGLADAVGWVGAIVIVAVSVSLAVACIWRMGTASRHDRAAFALVAAAGLLLAGAAVAREVALVGSEPEDPTTSKLIAIFLSFSAGALLLAVGLVLPTIRGWLARRALLRLAAELGDSPAPGSVEGALRAAIGDPTLEVAFWVRDAERFVDVHGRALADGGPTDGRSSVTVRRGDETVAVVSHDPAAPGELLAQIGPATKLALENERIRVELLAQLEELAESRRRIIEIGDDERRRIERDLHDSVQQELLALAAELRGAHAAAEQAGETVTAESLDRATRAARTALADVRELAHGVFPAILTDAGLAAAVESLADRSEVAVVIEELSSDRFSAAVETTAYQAVAAGIERAAALLPAATVRVSVRREPDLLSVELKDDCSDVPSGAAALPGTIDERVRALGGRIEIGPAAGGGTVVTVLIPCA